MRSSTSEARTASAREPDNEGAKEGARQRGSEAARQRGSEAAGRRLEARVQYRVVWYQKYSTCTAACGTPRRYARGLQRYTSAGQKLLVGAIGAPRIGAADTPSG
eukprot:165978-Rhodomonas_salina.1